MTTADSRGGAAGKAVMPRDCYCDLWNSNPASLERRGVPRGFCGHCERCGQPGHTRHFPGAVPYTGAWCDRHYRRILYFDPRSSRGCLLWLAVTVVVAAILVGTLLR